MTGLTSSGAAPEPNSIYVAARFLYAGVLYGLVEYLVHRYTHHEDPIDDGFRVVSEKGMAVYSAVLMMASRLGLVYGVTAALMVWWYMVYEVFRCICHDSHPSKSLDFVWRANLHHTEHRREPTRHFGVTTTGWDAVFGTSCTPRTPTGPHEFVPVLAFVLAKD